ncbi:sterol desaturase family protein [Chitinophaga costaii]|nr:sterol desaturase family protein [Chitinophaga costaii]
MAFAIPLFLALMGAEWWYSRKTGKHYFNFRNSISNLNVGIAERLIDTFTTGIFYFVYLYLYKHFALFHFKSSILQWIALLICTDFIWYWYHRLAHEMNIFWAAHVVHHQSDDFNYTVSARITVFQAIIRTGFWAVLPVLGFAPGMITSMLLVHGLYPFFIHTRTIGKLGFLEYFLVTPSHHRVHHASDEDYLDKNYGDVFIIWDKLFGTFVAETHEPVYGLTKPLESHSFLWQHFHFYLELLHGVRRTEGFKNKIKLIFGKPDLLDPTIRPKLEEKYLLRNDTVQATRRLHDYVVIQIAITLAGLFTFLLLEYYIPAFVQALITLFILITLINCGAILEQRRWVFYLEYARFSLIFIAAYCYFPYAALLWIPALVLPMALYYDSKLKQQYLRLVYGRTA